MKDSTRTNSQVSLPDKTKSLLHEYRMSSNIAENMPRDCVQGKVEDSLVTTSSLQMESLGDSPDATQTKNWQLIPIIGSLWLGTMLVAIDNTIIGTQLDPMAQDSNLTLSRHSCSQNLHPISCH
jgi:hypothetical protein